MAKLLKNKLVVFLGLSLILYVAWQLVYHELISPYTGIDNVVSMNLANMANILLHIFDYQSIVDYLSLEDFIIVRMTDSIYPGVRIGNPCNGMSLFGLFAAVIVAFPSNNSGGRKLNLKKLWFIPLGILLIHFINVIRVAILTVIASYNFEWLNFNHDVTFKVVTYAFIFLLWYIWINKMSGFKFKKQNE
ncbi:MAG: exosortase family protein XrtF [Parvicellaceae bacterium]|jgi:exosortase family protein XrtF